MQTLASLRLVPGPDTVAQAISCLESTAEREAWPARLTFRLSLCLDEALTNIVEHGFKDRPADAQAADISLDIAAAEGRITIEIVDNGAPFDPTRQAPAALAESLEDAQIGGHGLRLMRHYLETIEYQRVDHRNHLRLTAAA